jgi:hypothetical protein
VNVDRPEWLACLDFPDHLVLLVLRVNKDDLELLDFQVQMEKLGHQVLQGYQASHMNQIQVAT